MCPRLLPFSELTWCSLDEPAAVVEKFEVVDDGYVGWIELIGFQKLVARLFHVSAQHHRVTLIVQNLDGRPGQLEGIGISLISKIKSPQAIIARCQADPGGRILGCFLDGVAEISLRKSIVAAPEVLHPEPQRLVGRIVLAFKRLLHGRGCLDRRIPRGRLAARECKDEPHAGQYRLNAPHHYTPPPTFPARFYFVIT